MVRYLLTQLEDINQIEIQSVSDVKEIILPALPQSYFYQLLNSNYRIYIQNVSGNARAYKHTLNAVKILKVRIYQFVN